MYTSNQFHTSQAVQVTETQRIVQKASTCVFVGAMSLYASTVLPSHWVQKITTMSIASGLVYVSLRLDKLGNLTKPYEAIAHQTSTASYQAWLNHAMQPPKKEAQVTQEIIKPIPTHPILKALYGLKIECDFVQELRSPSFIRTLVKPTNCKASQVLNTGQELQLELGLNAPPVMSISNGAIAIDTPRPDRQSAKFADYWQPSPKFEAAIGVDINNKLISIDLSQPESCHILGAGTTGSGKSVFLQSLLLSLLLQRSIADLRLLICDAKRVSFQKFKDCAHLIAPIMSQPDEAIDWLEQMVNEMEKRYSMFERLGVENIESFNQRSSEKLPRILFLFDEFGDLWDSCTKAQVEKLENLIIRLGQKARAAGIHLVVFTQRPKKVVSPRLRSNCPARVLLTVADSADSEAILGNKNFDGSQLLGRGDLFFNGDRLQSLLADESDFAKLLMGNNFANTHQNTANIADPNQQSAPSAFADTTSAPSAQNQQSANLSAPLQMIVDYADRKADWISARMVQSGIAIFKSTKADEIREYFQYLTSLGYGITRGADDALEFFSK
ncbi:FtsK/SpoIIIE domain-containing protein [Pseudanabaena sp. 'Roaring Creek']|uniref:FtsK/SpoIIIE domain-containing protein n=1 Tax=Pseudanabaena sp. 'Roaring Creek' TaxID=1681830 RepID=UPI0006D76CC7|nr:FtsK/SpoIIIE domain-containing protein [Pseudanabaena sp. 'Roaring Creek']